MKNNLEFIKEQSIINHCIPKKYILLLKFIFNLKNHLSINFRII